MSFYFSSVPLEFLLFTQNEEKRVFSLQSRVTCARLLHTCMNEWWWEDMCLQRTIFFITIHINSLRQLQITFWAGFIYLFHSKICSMLLKLCGKTQDSLSIPISPSNIRTTHTGLLNKNVFSFRCRPLNCTSRKVWLVAPMQSLVIGKELRFKLAKDFLWADRPGEAPLMLFLLQELLNLS